MSNRRPRKKTPKGTPATVQPTLFTDAIVTIVRAQTDPFQETVIDNVSPWIMSVYVEMALCYTMPGTRWHVEIIRPEFLDLNSKAVAIIKRLS